MRSEAHTDGGPRLPLTGHVRWPVLDHTDRSAVMAVLDRGVLSGSFAPELRDLERSFAAYVGSKHAVATNSGTAAIHLALASVGVGPGDEVVTPAYSFVATALAILHQGAVPVFVDIEETSWGMDPELAERAVTPRTKAFLPVHVHGTPCDIDALAILARKRGIPLVEDAAQAHGSSIGSKKVGTIGAAGCFSFQSSKAVPSGEGGILVTDDDDVAARARRARAFGEDLNLEDEADYRIEHALDGGRSYESVAMGFMYRPTELGAALARTQLAKLDGWTERARANAERLSRRLRSLPGVEPPAIPEGRTSNFHKYRVRLDPRRAGFDISPRDARDAMVKALRAEGVLAVLWQTMPVPNQRLFRDRLGVEGLHAYPKTKSLLDGSLVLFSQSYPIACQPPSLCDAYADAFERAWTNLPRFLERVARQAAP